MLHCHLLIHAEIHLYILDTYRRNDNRRKNKGRMIKTQEDFFRKIFTSHFIARVRKGCSRFACERVLETEHNLHILTPTVMTVTLCLSCSPDSGVHSIRAFRGPPRSGVAFPTTSGLYSLEVCWPLLWHPKLNYFACYYAFRPFRRLAKPGAETEIYNWSLHHAFCNKMPQNAC